MNPIPLISVVLFATAITSTSAPPVEWVYSMADAKSQAVSINKPILIYCWSEGSDYCGKLWQETLSADDATCYDPGRHAPDHRRPADAPR